MATSKLDADAFLYLNPEPGVEDFAQCFSCRDWVRGDDRCVIHGPYMEVPGTASCGLYVCGEVQPPGTETIAVVSPTESGLVDREVRCENCISGGPGVHTCKLFVLLNKTLPEEFDIDTAIDPKGCCNANRPR
jgi:hypothetical protein